MSLVTFIPVKGRRSSLVALMLRGMRRRFSQTRGAPLATFALRVLAVSPYPEEPEGDEGYRPTLIVELEPAPDRPAPGAGAVAIGTLLFVEWAQARLDDATLPLRLRALLPRLRVAVESGRVGPHTRAQHRRNQGERYFNHREAAAYTVELHRDEGGVYVAVDRRVAHGRWTEAATTLEAATVAPYEALLRLDPAAAAALLAWQGRAVARWLDAEDAAFPVADWDPDRPPAPPGEPGG